MSKVLNLIKKVGRVYRDSVIMYYRPLIDAKTSPLFI